MAPFANFDDAITQDTWRCGQLPARRHLAVWVDVVALPERFLNTYGSA
jgi:hypothetical protein